MKGFQLLSASILGLALLGCGPASPDELITAGHSSLSSGDPQDALAKFQEAAAALEPSDPRFLDAKLGVAEALIVNEPKKATEEFLALSTAHPEQVGEKQFEYMVGLMVSSKQYMNAVELVEKGVERFGAESTTLRGMTNRIKKEAASDAAVQSRLQGNPYVE